MTDGMESKTAEITFEEAMQQLEIIVKKLESGDVPLEKAIQLFQEGMTLSKLCHDKLHLVEQQVSLLLEDEGKLIEKPFELEEDFS